MRKKGKKWWALLLACWMVVSAAVPTYAAQSGGETVQPMLAEPARTDSICRVSGSSVLSVTNSYTALDDAVTRVVITTYVEKRKALVTWERVDIGQPNNKWIDVIYGDGGSMSHSVQLPASGTYRVTATFDIYAGSSLLDTVTQTNKVTC